MSRERFLSLVAQKLSDGLSDSEEAELAEMLAKDKNIRLEYSDLMRYWSRKESHLEADEQLFKKLLSRLEEAEGNQTMVITRKINIKRILYIAASLIILIGLTLKIYQLSKPGNDEIYTGHSSRSVLLADGTTVTLNTDSKLIYPVTFGDGNREVTLVGEAFFDVQEDKQHPFIIHTAQADVYVLGTSLNLRAYPNEAKTETSLIKGAVAVSLNERQHKKILLRPKQKLIIRKNLNKEALLEGNKQQPMVQLANVNYLKTSDTIAVETLWLQNKLAFKNERFDDLSLALERRYDVKISFEGQRAQALRFNAVFEKEDIKQVLNALKIAAPFGYHIKGNRIEIYD